MPQVHCQAFLICSHCRTASCLNLKDLSDGEQKLLWTAFKYLLEKFTQDVKKQTGVCSFITAFSGYQQWHTQSCTLLLFNVFDDTVLCELPRSFSLLFLAVSTSLHFVCNIFSQKYMICLLPMTTWTDVLHGCVYPQVRQVPLCANGTFPSLLS